MEVEKNSYYTFITTNYVKQGGDGYSMLISKSLVTPSPQVDDESAIIKYFNQTGISIPEIQGRITMIKSNSNVISLHYICIILTLIAFFVSSFYY